MAAQPKQSAIHVDVPTLQIRRMRPADVAGIMAIESVSFGKHHWSEDSFLNEMKNQLSRYYSLVKPNTNGEASEEGNADTIVGYCGYWLILDEVHITTVAVHPDYRGNSLGEVQLLQILDRCFGQTVHWITLEVRITNYSAQNLYYKYGFKSDGIRPKYYQDNREDALIMTTPNINTALYRDLYKKRKEALIEKISGLPQGFGQA